MRNNLVRYYRQGFFVVVVNDVDVEYQRIKSGLYKMTNCLHWPLT